VIAGPEYNKALSGVLKNALDWVSRVEGQSRGATSRWRSCRPPGGRAGGERTQFSLRLCMMPFRANVLPGPEVLVGQATDQFDADGRLTNERNLAALEELMADLRAEAGLQP
jgi:chromate reductase